jgi:hypothetical protein
MALSTSDLDRERLDPQAPNPNLDRYGNPVNPQSLPNRDAYGNPTGPDNRLTEQQIADRNRGLDRGLDRGLVTITVDGHAYRVQSGSHSMASLAKTAVLVDAPNFLGAKVLHSRKNEKFQAADTITIEGGEVFTSSTTGAPEQHGFNRYQRPDGHVDDNRTDAQRAADQRYTRDNPAA